MRLFPILAAAPLLLSGAIGAQGAVPVVPTVYVSPEGSDGGDCTQTSPCKTFNRAYRVARPGQVIEVAAGTYEPQRLRPDSSKDSQPAVVFRPALGSVVGVPEGVDVFASNVVFAGSGLDTGFVFGAWAAKPGAHDLMFEKVNTGIFSISGAANISVLGGQVGPWAHGSDSQITSRNGVPPTNILIDGVYFHDIQPESSGQHIECLQIGAGQNLVIQNSRFVRCSDHDVFIRTRGSSADKLLGFTIQNNYFGQTTRGFYTGQFSTPSGDGGTCDNFKLRDNVLEQGWTIRCAPPDDTPEAVQVSGNYWAFPDLPSACGVAGIWRSNIFEKRAEKPCDPSAKVIPASRQLPLSRDDAVRRIRGIGFRCGDAVKGDRTSVVVCALGGKRFLYRIVVVGGTDGQLRLITARALPRSGTASDAAKMFGALASVPLQAKPKLVGRANRFVARGLGKTADAKIGAARLRVYTDGDDLNLLVSSR